MSDTIELREVVSGEVFVLLRTDETFRRVGIKTLYRGGPVRVGQVAVVPLDRPRKGGGVVFLSSRCHVRVVVNP